jgi:CRP-like cAMP-binding protein
VIQIQRLPSEIVKELQKIGLRIVKPEGSVLFRAGDRCRGAFLIRSGRVKLSFEGNDKVYASRVLGPGCMAGLPATVSGGAYTLSAEVVADARLDWIPRAKLLAFLHQNPEVSGAILLLLSEEISRMRKAVKSAAPLLRSQGLLN